MHVRFTCLQAFCTNYDQLQQLYFLQMHVQGRMIFICVIMFLFIHALCTGDKYVYVSALFVYMHVLAFLALLVLVQANSARMHACVYMHVYMKLSIYCWKPFVCVCVCVCACARACSSVCMYLCAQWCIWSYMYVRMYVCMYVCMHLAL